MVSITFIDWLCYLTHFWSCLWCWIFYRPSSSSLFNVLAQCLAMNKWPLCFIPVWYWHSLSFPKCEEMYTILYESVKILCLMSLILQIFQLIFRINLNICHFLQNFNKLCLHIYCLVQNQQVYQMFEHLSHLKICTECWLFELYNGRHCMIISC